MSGSVKNMSKWLRSSGYHVLNFIAINLQLHKIFKIKRVRFLGHSVNYSGHISYRFCATVDLMPKWPRWATVTSKWQWRSIHITSEMKSPWDWAKNYLWQRFRVNPCIIFCVSLQTDRQTNRADRIISARAEVIIPGRSVSTSASFPAHWALHRRISDITTTPYYDTQPWTLKSSLSE